MSNRHTFAKHTAPRLTGGTKFLSAVSVLLGLLMVGGSEAAQSDSHGANAEQITRKESRMWMTIGERRFPVTLADNAATRALAAQLPLTLDMQELNGNEKHGELPKALPANASRPGTIRNGDLMLYGTATLVIFYETFNSSYSYTRLGRADDPAGLAKALGPRGVRVVFSKD